MILAIEVYGSPPLAPREGWETARCDAAQPTRACRRIGEVDVAGRSVFKRRFRSGLPRTEITGAKPFTKYYHKRLAVFPSVGERGLTSMRFGTWPHNQEGKADVICPICRWSVVAETGRSGVFPALLMNCCISCAVLGENGRTAVADETESVRQRESGGKDGGVPSSKGSSWPLGVPPVLDGLPSGLSWKDDTLRDVEAGEKMMSSGGWDGVRRCASRGHVGDGRCGVCPCRGECPFP